MSNKIKIKNKYTGFSLIELLLTMMILGVISLLVGVTLNTIIKVSNSTNSKNLARNNANYIMELVKRSVTNAQLEYVYLFKSDSRTVNFSGSDITVTSADASYEIKEKLEGIEYNEIHIKLYASDAWYCIGYFKDSKGYGYILQSVRRGDQYNEDNPGSCISDSTSSPITILHSLKMDIVSLNLGYIDVRDVGDEANSIIDVEMEIRALYWPLRQNALVKPSITKRSLVSTEALSWY